MKSARTTSGRKTNELDILDDLFVFGGRVDGGLRRVESRDAGRVSEVLNGRTCTKIDTKAEKLGKHPVHSFALAKGTGKKRGHDGGLGMV